MTDPERITGTTDTGVCPHCGEPSKMFILGDTSYHLHCDKCAAKHKAGEQDRRDHAKRLRLQLIEQGRAANFRDACPPLYRDSDESRFPKATWARVKAWTPGSRGLLLAGPTKMCKTRMMWAMLKPLMLRGVGVRAYDSARFGHDCIDAFMTSGGSAWFGSLCKCQVLFLDDLGKTPATERVEAELFGVIDTRIANLLPILATTNAAGAELTERLSADRGAPMIRRLREFCDLVVCDDSDGR